MLKSVITDKLHWLGLWVALIRATQTSPTLAEVGNVGLTHFHLDFAHLEIELVRSQQSMT